MRTKATVTLRPMNIVTLQSSDAEVKYRIRAGASMNSKRALASGIQPTPAHDLIFYGGKTLPTLNYANFYIGGRANWKASDITNIDRTLAAALSDDGLNNVLAQYFTAMPVTHFLDSNVLRGSKPSQISQGDIEMLVAKMFDSGQLNRFDLPSTVLSFLLPKGTILNDNPKIGAKEGKDKTRHAANVDSAATDSLHGLGGYHGSVHRRRRTIYYAVGVYSERTAQGDNGIAVFKQPWKNVVATLYHELCEARTDPDVEDAIKQSSNQLAGWLSKQGEEIGDFPIFEANPLTLVFKEVSLTSGRSAPVQFMYSNQVHGPEGPRSTPYPFRSAARRTRSAGGARTKARRRSMAATDR